MNRYSTDDLEQLLSKSRQAPRASPPVDLHGDIMRAVRQAQPEPQRPVVIRNLGWALASAAILALAVVIVLPPRQQPHEPVALSVEEPLNTARTLAQQLRTSAPLQDEATSLADDARTAADFLLANLPSI